MQHCGSCTCWIGTLGNTAGTVRPKMTKSNPKGMENICQQFSEPVASTRKLIKFLAGVVKPIDFELDGESRTSKA